VKVPEGSHTQVHRFNLQDTDICSLEEGGASCWIQLSDFYECKEDDRLEILAHGVVIFSGEIVAWEMGSDMRIHADNKDILNDAGLPVA
jgi:hypothetical protein